MQGEPQHVFALGLTRLIICSADLDATIDSRDAPERVPPTNNIHLGDRLAWIGRGGRPDHLEARSA